MPCERSISTPWWQRKISINETLTLAVFAGAPKLDDMKRNTPPLPGSASLE